MFLVAFYGFFRVGELTTKSRVSFSTVLQYSNVSFRMKSADICGVKLILTRFKHNTINRPHDIIIDREDSSLFCPAKSLLAYLRLRSHSHGPLFCNFDRSPITTRYFNSELRRCLIFRGLDTSRYKSHGFRIGAPFLVAEQVILTLKFVLLVGGTPMRLKFILDPLLYMLTLLRLCSLGICSLPVLSFSCVLFAHLVLRQYLSTRLAL